MHTPFDAAAERALYSFCAALPYSHVESTMGPLAMFDARAFPDAPPSWKAWARLALSRLAIFPILALQGALLGAGLPVGLWERAERAARWEPRAAQARQALGRAMLGLWDARTRCVFGFGRDAMASYAYQRLACFWIRALLRTALAPLSHPFFLFETLESPEGPSIAQEFMARMERENMGATGWGNAMRSGSLTPEGFADIDRLWALCGHRAHWAPAPALPSFADLRLACSRLALEAHSSYTRAHEAGLRLSCEACKEMLEAATQASSAKPRSGRL